MYPYGFPQGSNFTGELMPNSGMSSSNKYPPSDVASMPGGSKNNALVQDISNDRYDKTLITYRYPQSDAGSLKRQEFINEVPVVGDIGFRLNIGRPGSLYRYEFFDFLSFNTLLNNDANIAKSYVLQFIRRDSNIEEFLTIAKGWCQEETEVKDPGPGYTMFRAINEMDPFENLDQEANPWFTVELEKYKKKIEKEKNIENSSQEGVKRFLIKKKDYTQWLNYGDYTQNAENQKAQVTLLIRFLVDNDIVYQWYRIYKTVNDSIKAHELFENYLRQGFYSMYEIDELKDGRVEREGGIHKNIEEEIEEHIKAILSFDIPVLWCFCPKTVKMLCPFEGYNNMSELRKAQNGIIRKVTNCRYHGTCDKMFWLCPPKMRRVRLFYYKSDFRPVQLLIWREDATCKEISQMSKTYMIDLLKGDYIMKNIYDGVRSNKQDTRHYLKIQGFPVQKIALDFKEKLLDFKAQRKMIYKLQKIKVHVEGVEL